ncbi:DNA cytosine methyltransferase [Biomphalaria pfeifferi]|uniref:DNA cytosine methyltransferase n=1 Tax=Biomphalaria pfeifferi TaxID=112525 RepID=A0AAD8EU76_BIOPF|nr:DNA cytosine methyltransferase [Biomphalaria pfeifferi]
MEEAILDNAPVWDDLTTFDSKPWRRIVDIISAGFPCQPHSQAGKQKGTADERWLWDSISAIIGEILPEIVWLENVPNLAFSGLDRVIGSLSEAGYNSVWDTFSAEETGASQERERLFIFSYTDSFIKRMQQAEWETWRNLVSSSYWENLQELVFAACDGRQTRQINESLREFEPSGVDLAHSAGKRRQVDREEGSSRRSAIEPTVDFVFPPFRNDYEGWKKYLAGRPHLKPSVLRSSDGLANRMDRTRSIGNGVVPIVAAYAFISLMRTAWKINL